jgi:hypothetical protein
MQVFWTVSPVSTCFNASFLDSASGQNHFSFRGHHLACPTILTEHLNMRRISAKLGPRVLTIEQKEHRLLVASNLLRERETDQKFLEDIVTGNMTWVYGYDPETKHQSSSGK